MLKEDIRFMSVSQMEFILKLYDSPLARGFAEGKAEGGIAKEVYRKGYIEPAGKVGRRIRWQLVKNKFSKKDIALMRELVRGHIKIPDQGRWKKKSLQEVARETTKK